MQLKTIEQKKVFQIPRSEVDALKVVIVGRDSMTSGLLADSLVRSLKCNAVAIQSADLLRELGTSKTALVIISAHLGSTPRAGFELAKTVSQLQPEIPIIIMLDQPNRDAVITAFRSGARGVFNHQESMSEFIDCIEHVSKGFVWAGKIETDYFLEAFRNIPASRVLTENDFPALTTRELQVVQCAARGKTNKAIASELFLSEHTVKNYLFRAFEKLEVSSRVELLFYLAIRGHSFGPQTIGQENANDEADSMNGLPVDSASSEE